MQKAVETSKSRSAQQSADAIAVLTADHANVRKLFKQYESIKDSASAADRSALAAEICAELTAHATAEEEVFYPAVRDAIDDDDLLDEAEVEHGSAKELIAQIAGMEADAPLFNAKIKVLAEYIEHHVKEEEGEMFPKVRKSKLDLVALGAEVLERKEEILAEILSDDDQSERD